MKRFLALLLAMIMALSLCACGQKEDTAPDQGGNVIDPPVTDPGQTPASPNSGPEAALYQKYKDIIDDLEDGHFNSAIQRIVKLAWDATPKDPVTPISDYFTGEWHLDTDEIPTEQQFLTLKINGDGTVTLGSETYSLLENGASDSSLGYWLLKDGVHSYYLTMNKSAEHVIPVMNLYMAQVKGSSVSSGDFLGVYTADPMTGILKSSWRNLDPEDKVLPKYLYIYQDRAEINGTKLAWTVTETSDTAISAKLGTTHTVTVELRGDKPIACLTELATGSSACYYIDNDRYGYDRSWKEFIYPRAMQYLNYCIEDYTKGYSPGFTSYLDGQDGVGYSGIAATEYLYNTFRALGDYKDSAQIAADFTILEGKLLYTQLDRVNHMGNTSSTRTTLYAYNVHGQMIYGNDYDLFLRYGGNSSTNKYYFYDEQGNPVKIQQGNDNNISALIELTNDANGNPVSGSYKSNSYSDTLSYVYDANGRLAESTVWSGSYRYKTTYRYDAEGRLAETVTLSGDKSDKYQYNRETTAYTYDAEGRLLNKLTQYERYSSWDEQFHPTNTSAEYRYTAWDAQGRPLTAEYIALDSNGKSEYASQILNYIYEDLYFYQDYLYIYTYYN